MSSYMLNDEEFSSISDWLYCTAKSKISIHNHDVLNYLGFSYRDDEHATATSECIKKRVSMVTKHLYELNRLAQTTRYNEPYETLEEKIFNPKLDNVSFHKFISITRSLLYQCAEAFAHETETYKNLEAFIHELCYNYVVDKIDELTIV